jgi:hypothetical protein
LTEPKYRAERVGRSGSSPQDYQYRIWRGSDHVADFFHDFRGDYRWFEIDGVHHEVRGPVFPLDWGPGNPIHVTEAGEELLDKLLSK